MGCQTGEEQFGDRALHVVHNSGVSKKARKRETTLRTITNVIWALKNLFRRETALRTVRLYGLSAVTKYEQIFNVQTIARRA